jgi:hypothetical protein
MVVEGWLVRAGGELERGGLMLVVEGQVGWGGFTQAALRRLVSASHKPWHCLCCVCVRVVCRESGQC